MFFGRQIADSEMLICSMFNMAVFRTLTTGQWFPARETRAQTWNNCIFSYQMFMKYPLERIYNYVEIKLMRWQIVFLYP